jgi:uncharacterized protein (TIGR02757 family)
LAALKHSELKDFLDEKVDFYNRPDFIPNDPICIPHLFNSKQDIEISGFWTSMLAWGQRPTIISKCKELFQLMDMAPYDFICNHTDSDLKRMMNFKHRTFNTTDTLYFIHWFRWYYQQFPSLESAFSLHLDEADENVKNAIIGFHNLFFSLEIAPSRTKKHVSTPNRNSACKRINMFLRWMVRRDERGVDFGIWRNINPSQLVCPCDLHVDRVARRFGLITRKQTDWATAEELTLRLKEWCPEDPVKYDFALFTLGIIENY